MTQQPHICTDDYGNGVYRCRYTSAIMWPEECVVAPALIPGVRHRMFMASTTEAKAKHKSSVRAFHENDANCNTCRHLIRSSHEKNSAGFLFGKCAATGDALMFHPDDAMLKSCWTARN